MKTLVTHSEPDGAKISKSLAGLGDKVKAVADEQGGVIGTALTTLSHALTKGSESLASK